MTGEEAKKEIQRILNCITEADADRRRFMEQCQKDCDVLLHSMALLVLAQGGTARISKSQLEQKYERVEIDKQRDEATGDVVFTVKVLA